jgi:aspartate kinase
LVVQKFGGTSLATAEFRELAAARVQACRNSGFQLVVVVSAMGRIGSPYATDTLLALANESAQLSGRSHDLIASCGEIISAVVFSQVLKSLQIDAVPLTGAQAGIITNGVFRTARVKAIDCSRIRAHVEAGQIPVVAGYQGLSDSGEIATLGRGGSDTTACMLGAALQASRVEIYTDVDGLMTADPRLVSEARLISKAEYSEVRTLAQKGAKVIHPEALEFASVAGVPLHILSAVSSVPGTVVHFSSETSPVTGIASFSDIDFFS